MAPSSDYDSKRRFFQGMTFNAQKGKMDMTSGKLKQKKICDEVRASALSDVMSPDDIEAIITLEEDACLRRYCTWRWGHKGENVLHRAYMSALESIQKSIFNPTFQESKGKKRKRSPFFNYVAGSLKSAYVAEQLATGWSTRVYATEKVWEQTEMPASVMRVDDGKDHGIESFADPDDWNAQLFKGEGGSDYEDFLDAQEFSHWLIREINSYAEYLLSICAYGKLFVLQALCTKNIRLKDVAERRGLRHSNMTLTVAKVRDELALRTGIPSVKIQKGLHVIKHEIALNSQLTINTGGEVNE